VKVIQIWMEDGSQLTVAVPPNGRGFYRITDKSVQGVAIVEHEVNISYVSKTPDTG
jgi:hypothetical protein